MMMEILGMEMGPLVMGLGPLGTRIGEMGPTCMGLEQRWDLQVWSGPLGMGLEQRKDLFIWDWGLRGIGLWPLEMGL